MSTRVFLSRHLPRILSLVNFLLPFMYFLLPYSVFRLVFTICVMTPPPDYIVSLFKHLRAGHVEASCRQNSSVAIAGTTFCSCIVLHEIRLTILVIIFQIVSAT